MPGKARVSEGTGYEEKEGDRQSEREGGDEVLMEAACKGGNGEEASMGGYE